MIFAIFSAVLSGLTRVVSRMVNAQLSSAIGPFESTFYNYMTGLACSLAVVFLLHENLQLDLVLGAKLPLIAYLGGFVGVLFIVLSNAISPKLSVFQMTLLIFLGQIGGGLMIDLLLGTNLSFGKLLGGALVLVGLIRFNNFELKNS